MSLNPVKVIVIEGVSDEALKKRSHLEEIPNSNDLPFQLFSMIPSNKVSKQVKEEDPTKIILKLSKEGLKSPRTLKQILEESPDTALFVRIDKNNQEFFNWILKSRSKEEFLEDRQNNFSKPQEKKIGSEDSPREDHFTSIILEEVSDAIYIKDLQGRYIMMNSAGATIIGKSLEEIMGKDDTELFSPETAKKVMEADRRIIRSGKHETYEVNVPAGGVTRTTLTRKKPFHDSQGNIVGIIGISLDVTERKLAEERLKSEQAFRTAIEDSMGAGVVAADLNGQLLYVNPAFCDMVGWTKAELIGTSPPFIYWPPEDIETLSKEFQNHLSVTGPRKVEYRIRRRNGERFPVLVLRSSLNDGNGTLLGVVKSFYDITDRKRIEETLHQTNQMLKSLIQANPLATMILDREGMVRMWSPAAERIFGWKEKEVVGCFLPIVPDDQRNEFLKNILSVIEGKRVMGLEVQRQRKGGIPIEVSVWGVPLSDSDGNRQGLFVVADITEKREMEEAILRVQKLESLGILAGGLAHDFNNIMTAVLGNISMAKFLINEPGQLRITIDEAEKATLRAIHLAHQLLTFAKGGGPVKKVTSIGELVKESAGFALRGSNVRFEYTLHNDLWAVEIEEGQISQVIHNLVFNAQQAASAGGTLHIKVENVHVEDDNKTGLKKGHYVRIAIKDFGFGSSKENILKVFDPNYTANQNTSALRFASACSIARRHGGTITVETEREITLFIYLPAIPPDVSPRLTIAEKTMKESGKPVEE
jgi:PAS domain S-box-containing protein